MVDKFRFWNIVFYASWIVVAVWLVLKSFGVINTPFWLEYGVPISGLMFGALSLYGNISASLRDLAVGLASLGVKFEHLEIKVDRIESDVEILKKRGV